jgi:hypothetical protein
MCGSANLSKLDSWLMGPSRSKLLQVYILATTLYSLTLL